MRSALYLLAVLLVAGLLNAVSLVALSGVGAMARDVEQDAGDDSPARLFAALRVCLDNYSPLTCIVIVDTRGPYTQVEECSARLKAMVRELPAMLREAKVKARVVYVGACGTREQMIEGFGDDELFDEGNAPGLQGLTGDGA